MTAVIWAVGPKWVKENDKRKVYKRQHRVKKDSKNMTGTYLRYLARGVRILGYIRQRTTADSLQADQGLVISPLRLGMYLIPAEVALRWGRASAIHFEVLLSYHHRC